MEPNPTYENISDDSFLVTAYKHISKLSANNVLMSVLSVEILLKMLLLETNNKSDVVEELRTILGPQKIDEEKLRETIKKVIDLTHISEENYRVSILNKMYVEEGSDVNEDFNKSLFEVFGVHPESVKFSDAENTIEKINTCLSTATDGIINNLINLEDFAKDTKSILISTLYFEANWKNSFLKRLTTKLPFTKNDNEVIQTETLVGYINCNYHEIDEINVTLVELPFNDNKATMVIALPNEKDGFADIENKIEVVLGVKSCDFKKETIKILLPKFKIESKINFKNIQSSLEQFFEYFDVSGIFQEVFLEVGEAGVGKNAANPVDEKHDYFCCFFPPPCTKQFIVNHPFFFYIKMHNFILLAGRVYDPTSCFVNL